MRPTGHDDVGRSRSHAACRRRASFGHPRSAKRDDRRGHRRIGDRCHPRRGWRARRIALSSRWHWSLSRHPWSIFGHIELRRRRRRFLRHRGPRRSGRRHFRREWRFERFSSRLCARTIAWWKRRRVCAWRSTRPKGCERQRRRWRRSHSNQLSRNTHRAWRHLGRRGRWSRRGSHERRRSGCRRWWRQRRGSAPRSDDNVIRPRSTGMDDWWRGWRRGQSQRYFA